jgi:glutaredoxin/glutathione-dependent peroxiredoxin
MVNLRLMRGTVAALDPNLWTGIRGFKSSPPAIRVPIQPSLRYDGDSATVAAVQENRMSIQVGDRLPEATLNTLNNGVQAISIQDIFAGKKVVLFAVPGAFTPTCSAKHLPGFVEQLDAIKAKGIDTVACMSVNDAFVMQAWAKSQDVPEAVMMLADGNGAFTQKLGLELDATAFGMGMRSKRFALVADDGVVKQLFVEAPGEFKVSSAEHVLANL